MKIMVLRDNIKHAQMYFLYFTLCCWCYFSVFVMESYIICSVYRQRIHAY